MSRQLTLVVWPCLALGTVVGCATPPDPMPPASWSLQQTSEKRTSEVYVAEPSTGTTWIDEASERHVTVLLGQRMLDQDDWDPVEDQLAGGLEVDGSNPRTGHGYEVGLTYSQDDDSEGPVDFDGNTFDVYGGYRYTFHPEESSIHPYLSGGLAVIRAEAEVDTPGGNSSDDDYTPGVYVRAGIGFDLSEKTRLGVDYRHMFLTDVDIGNISDVDFDQLMLTLGFAF